MRVQLNLASSPSHRERYALAWSLPLLTAGILAMAFLAPLTVRNQREYAKVRREAAKLQEQQAALAAKEKGLRAQLQQPASLRTAREAAFVNELIEAKRLTVTDVAARVSTLMPASVRLKGLSLSLEHHAPEVHLAVTGKDEASVEDLLGKLESSPSFQDVAIVNEGFETAAPGEPIHVVFTARYVAPLPGREAKH
jgi:hypothetical protein